MAGIILSFFDQTPSFNGVTINVRGADGYFNVKDMNEAMAKTAGGKPKRFNDWAKTKFAQSVISEISALTGIPVDYDDHRSQSQTPLIDYKRGGNGGVDASRSCWCVRSSGSKVVCTSFNLAGKSNQNRNSQSKCC